MTIDPALLVAAIGAMGGLLLVVVRAFTTGAILPRSAVPREDYEALRQVNADYAAGFGTLIEAVKTLSAAVERITPNGAK